MNIIKRLFFVLLIGLVACDEIPDGVVEQTTTEYTVKSITSPANFVYTQSDSNLVVSIELDDKKNIDQVWLSAASLDKELVVTDQINMEDDGITSVTGDLNEGDNIYTAKIPMSKELPNGEYVIDFYVNKNVNNYSVETNKVGAQIFNYNNNQSPLNPVISNLVIPVLVARGESFIFTMKVNDQNGLADIDMMFFKLFRPDGTLAPDTKNSRDYFTMVDNGDAVLGDQTANDGIYSFKNSFGESSQTGKWRFEFQAKDREGLLSNTIIYELTVN